MAKYNNEKAYENDKPFSLLEDEKVTTIPN